jgi:hypothetical protein
VIILKGRNVEEKSRGLFQDTVSAVVKKASRGSKAGLPEFDVVGNDWAYMYNEPSNAHPIDSLLYCSIFIATTCFNTNASS